MTQSKVEVLRQVFPGMEERDLTELANVSKLQDYPAGAILCREDEAEDTFYIIVKGQAEVTKQLDGGAQATLNRPGAGQFVGEIALVQEGTRTATVRTTEPTTVLEIGHQDFIDMLYHSASMAVRIMLEITPRVRDIDKSIIANLRQRNAELTEAYEELRDKYEALLAQK